MAVVEESIDTYALIVRERRRAQGYWHLNTARALMPIRENVVSEQRATIHAIVRQLYKANENFEAGGLRLSPKEK